MNTSKELDQISKALTSFQSKRPKIDLNGKVEVKTKSGGSYSFKYATLSYIIEMIQPVLTECKLSFSQVTEMDGGITTMLMHESGQWISGSLNLNEDKNDPQATGSAITYAKRYSLASILGLATEEDDDGNYASGNKAEKEDIKDWLKENQFNQIKEALMSGDSEKIAKAKQFYKDYSKPPKGMKKIYRDELKSIINNLKNE